MNDAAPEPVRFYDAHCHLQDPRLDAERVIEQLKALGVERIVVNGTQEEDWDRVVELATKYRLVLPSLGLHPWHVDERTTEWFAKLSDYVHSTRCAIGEIGLDRWIEKYDSTTQEKIFLQQLALAAMLNRPVSIHCLKAWGRMFDLLSSQARPACGFLLHSYGGPAEMVDQFAALGAYFSFSGYFAHPRKARQREAFRRVPLDRLLIETDAPDMLPPDELLEFSIPGVNHPGNIRRIYQYAAGLFGIALERFALQIESNFLRLFGRPDS